MADESIFVCDRMLPVCVDLHRATGIVRRTSTWPLLDSLRHQPVVTAVRLHDGAVWISSPAAGGLVRIDTATFDHTLVRLDAMPGPIARLGDDLMVFAYREWRSAPHASADASPIERPVIWLDAPDREPSTVRWFMYSPDADPYEPVDESDEIDHDLDAHAHDLDLDLADDDFETNEDGARPVWRIVSGVPQPFDVGGDAGTGITMSDGTLVASVRRHSDPLVKVREAYGIAYRYPGAVIAFHPDGTSRTIREFDDGVDLVSDGIGLWFTAEDADTGETTLAPIELAGRVIEPRGAVVAIVAGRAVVVERSGPMRRLDLATGADLDDLAIPPIALDDGHEAVVDGEQVWFAGASPDRLITVDIGSSDVAVLAVTVDLDPLLPPATPRAGFDIADYERGALSDFRDELLGGWQDESGAVMPFIDGVTFISIDLVGSFPDTCIEVTFDSSERTGQTFGVRLALYDALGNDIGIGFAGIHMMELIDGWPGLPHLDQTPADESGVTWLEMY
ncbi:MAG: hypothetical protein Q8M22_17710 [Actinomycetota bacterium]|nr:hypothetical protein [Actinomycetota bacterium]